MAKEGYKSLSLPEELVNDIKKIIQEYPELGYKSVAEFIKDSVREKISQIQIEKKSIVEEKIKI